MHTPKLNYNDLAIAAMAASVSQAAASPSSAKGKKVKLRRLRPLPKPRSTFRKVYQKNKLHTFFEVFVYREFKNKKHFCSVVGCSQSLLSKWMKGTRPSHKFVMKIWELSKDEISPNYWFFQWPEELQRRKELKSLNCKV